MSGAKHYLEHIADAILANKGKVLSALERAARLRRALEGLAKYPGEVVGKVEFWLDRLRLRPVKGSTSLYVLVGEDDIRSKDDLVVDLLLVVELVTHNPARLIVRYLDSAGFIRIATAHHPLIRVEDYICLMEPEDLARAKRLVGKRLERIAGRLRKLAGARA